MSEKNNKNILYCSFCGKSQHEVRKLIAGPTVFICDECVELCMDIIKEENKDSFVNNQEGVPAPQEICKVLDEYVIGQTYAKEILLLKDRLNKIYAKHTKKSESEIKKALERDKFMTPNEAKDFGLIDEVVEKRS